MTSTKINAVVTAQAGRNDVVLVGRVSGDVSVRELPSGDLLSSWRLVVDREPANQGPVGHKPPTVDTIDCVGRRPRVRRLVEGWATGDTVEVHGALRRRFWRGPHGLGSRYEVEASTVRRLRRAVVR